MPSNPKLGIQNNFEIWKGIITLVFFLIIMGFGYVMLWLKNTDAASAITLAGFGSMGGYLFGKNKE